jgi:hypothetical protein
MIRRSTVVALVMLLVLAMAPGVAAKAHGTDRPMKWDMSGEINWEFEPIPGCAVQTVTDAWGAVTHAGWSRIHASHCPPLAPGEIYHDGRMTLTAANGDTLTFIYDFNGDPPYAADITGGTGRFAGATGHLHYTVEFTWAPWENGLPVAPWYANWHYWGTISY